MLLCRDDVAVNPNDTEESIWAYLCEAQLQGPDAARENMLKVGSMSPSPLIRNAHSIALLHRELYLCLVVLAGWLGPAATNEPTSLLLQVAQEHLTILPIS